MVPCPGCFSHYTWLSIIRFETTFSLRMIDSLSAEDMKAQWYNVIMKKHQQRYVEGNIRALVNRTGNAKYTHIYDKRSSARLTELWKDKATQNVLMIGLIWSYQFIFTFTRIKPIYVSPLSGLVRTRKRTLTIERSIFTALYQYALEIFDMACASCEEERRITVPKRIRNVPRFCSPHDSRNGKRESRCSFNGIYDSRQIKWMIIFLTVVSYFTISGRMRDGSGDETEREEIRWRIIDRWEMHRVMYTNTWVKYVYTGIATMNGRLRMSSRTYVLYRDLRETLFLQSTGELSRAPT